MNEIANKYFISFLRFLLNFLYFYTKMMKLNYDE